MECLPVPNRRNQITYRLAMQRPHNLSMIEMPIPRLFQRDRPYLPIGGVALQHFANAILH